MEYESLKLSNGPDVEPINLEDVKNHLRITGNAENAYLTTLIASARQTVEGWLNRALITQTWILTMDSAPSRIELPYAPLQSITSVKGYDWDNDSETQSSDEYLALINVEPGILLLKSGYAWPSHRGQASFEVTYKVGYGDAATDIPYNIKHGILLLITKLYERRGEDPGALIVENDVLGFLAGSQVLDI